ncbi:MAG: hypothetical protein CMP23_08305 [Rickettsiales bacterium]|nr:hypothetical protein [Rickettsiales bacterium]
MLAALLLLWVGYSASLALLPRCSPLERVAWTLLLGISLPAAATASVAYAAGAFIDRELLSSCAAGLALASTALAVLGRSSRADEQHTNDLCSGPAEFAIALLGLGTASFYWLHYSDAEFLYSLVSYLIRGEAECFYMQTFSFVAGLNAEATAPNVERAYQIISTPGNTLFSSSAMALAGRYGFQALYALFALNLFIFSARLVLLWTDSLPAALIAALFVCLNPYVLSVEVLDRNFIALSLSAAAIYALATHSDRYLLHGLLFGLCAGSGLRFLPLLFLISLALVYRLRRTRGLHWLMFGFGFVLVTGLNLPHLSFHGFHSLGETEALPELLLRMVRNFERSPFVPLPNLLFYPLHILTYMGSLCGALSLIGALRCWQKDRRPAQILLPMLLLPWLILGCQRDWLQSDKARILIMSMLPISVFIGYALESLISRRKLLQDLQWLLAGVLLIQGLASWCAKLERPVEIASYERHPLYQRDSRQWQDFYRAEFSKVNSLPSLDRLFFKANQSRKKRSDEALLRASFGQQAPPVLRDNPWVLRHLQAQHLAPLPPQPPATESRVVEIDLDKLVTAPHAAVRWATAEALPFADLTTESQHVQRLTDLGVDLSAWHKETEVSWQQQPLPVTVLTGQWEPATLNEFYVDLNAWLSLGRDRFELEQLNLVSFALSDERRELGLRGSMAALPPRDRTASIVLKVPRGVNIVLRNWLVDAGKGIPHRIDSWSISTDGPQPALSFHPLEPESYL